MNSQLRSKIFLITMSIIAVLTAWYSLEWLDRYILTLNSSVKEITQRADLYADEQKTIEIFEKASPSVVYITTAQRVRDYWSRNVFSIPRGEGSGFIWDAYGHVVTNFHVIDGVSEATVWLNNGKSYQASLVGVSPAHDLAVLKIDMSSDTPSPLNIGTSKDLKVGQSVYAIGNPFGLDYSLTSGIVSALDRTLNVGNGLDIEHLIQTDAAINPGNSGGPLLDSAGRLIGINTAIYSPSGAYAGIGFAVPVDTINRVVPNIIKNGRYIRASIGVVVSKDVNRMITSNLNIEGVVILDVKPNSSAHSAGLRGSRVSRYENVIVGDIITGIDGKNIKSISNLFSKLDEYNIGDKVTLDILRNEDSIQVDLILEGE